MSCRRFPGGAALSVGDGAGGSGRWGQCRGREAVPAGVFGGRGDDVGD